MAVGVAAGYPQHNFSLGTSKRIPILFEKRVQEQFLSKLSLESITNTDYQGDLKNVGDTVWIRTLGTVPVEDHVKGQVHNITMLDDPAIEFTVSKSKFYYIGISKLDAKQQDISWLDKYADRAIYDVKRTIETAYLADIYSSAAAKNKGITAGYKSGNINLGVSGTPFTLTKSNIVDKIIEMGQCLDEYDVPDDGGFYWIVPNAVRTLVMQSDLKDASLTGDGTSSLRTGVIGKIDRFTVIQSNLFTAITDGADTCYHTIFGHKKGVSFINQFVNTDYIEIIPGTDMKAIQGFNIYDWKAVQPTALGDFYVTL